MHWIFRTPAGDPVIKVTPNMMNLLNTVTVFFVPDEPSLRSVDKVDAVGGEVPPANIIGVMPQSSDLRK